MSLGPLPEEDLEFPCPRCGSMAIERFHGPCEHCRAELRATLGKAQTEVETTDYEPKMNVVPNAVASKE
jgi:hypothetical protein